MKLGSAEKPWRAILLFLMTITILGSTLSLLYFLPKFLEKQQATRVMGLIDGYRRALELAEVEERLRALEEVT